MKKTKKMMAGISAVALLSGLTACGPRMDSYTVQSSDVSNSIPSSNNNSYTSSYVEPDDPYCDYWEFEDYQDSEFYYCEDNDSDYFGQYYYKGKYYRDKNSVYTQIKSKNTSTTTSKNSSNSTKQSNSKNTSTQNNANTTTNQTSKSNSSSTSTNSNTNVSNSSSSTSTNSSSVSSTNKTSSGFGSGSSTFGG
ncbi:hypothetical protein [Litchfieldia alkalitelluris]|uniref:hypothetical protein n=1 Tax=Litchfieldia alkalitelluris TaxID=304268 RepID=UPI00099885C9|nr:hypothetical protein [Litchfieldia alkalitelluris]